VSVFCVLCLVGKKELDITYNYIKRVKGLGRRTDGGPLGTCHVRMTFVLGEMKYRRPYNSGLRGHVSHLSKSTLPFLSKAEPPSRPTRLHANHGQLMRSSLLFCIRLNPTWVQELSLFCFLNAICNGTSILNRLMVFFTDSIRIGVIKK
jgi:hypothetical protein